MLKKFFVVFLLLAIGVSQAQEGTTSPYSFYGIGTLKFKGTAENRAMSGISVYTDSIHVSLQNPAGVADLKLVNFAVGASHKFVTLQTDAEKQQATTTSLDYLAIGLPIGEKFGASFGLIPYTAVGYQLEGQNSLGTTQYEGSGGLNKAFVTLAYKISDGLSVGIDGNYNFGNIENVATSRQDGVQYATREENRSDLLGFSFNVGLSYKRMLNDKLRLYSSLTYTPETNFTSENSRTISTLLEIDSGAEAGIDVREILVDDTDFTFPSQWTLGAGIGQNKKWFIGGEYTDQKTSNFTNRTFEIENVSFKDASKYRVGGFYIPNYNSIGNYWQRVVYRGGFRFEETGINVNGQDINEFGISFGVGLPVGRLFSNVNLGFEIGTRGTKDFGLVQENFFNTFLSLSLNDKWFEKRYFE
ncbi:OmpP1/FadL family transporter [Rasiella sp. SM2506]|uniref:OmpP1/FadL family transporter n=1 Tax=Rasiella sp. SM2506 TaxID=3423914 RepID=UPI003D7B23B3